MASFVFDDAYVSLGGTDLSDHVRSVTLDTSADLVESQAMGDSWKERLGGLKDWSLSVEFLQDFAAAEVDATLWPLLGTTFTVAIRPTNAAAAPTNPEYTGAGALESYTPLGGSVGELAMAPITVQGAGELSRATA